MRVHLTFDVEVWCGGWDRLDASFPASFDRYVWGRSKAGDYALPRNLQILERHGLQAVFFVEPLFSFRFGHAHLCTIVELIGSRGQSVQLHLHPEWVDEIRPPLIDHCERKRQHLTDYSQDEQAALLKAGRSALERASSSPVTAFRSGGYATNRSTYDALAEAGIHIDSSLNATYDRTGGTLGPQAGLRQPCRVGDVEVHPVTVFSDALDRPRHMQVGACSFAEMREVLDQSEAAGLEEVVIVSHNFELLKPGGCQPDRVVERRFDRLCAYLASNRDRFEVGAFPDAALGSPRAEPARRVDDCLRVGALATAVRFVEQAVRRLP
jgi:peptidoglycan/xylan/chitin deacetylase (PgdA/CDA1 family)